MPHQDPHTTIQDIVTRNNVYGEPVALVQGKATRDTPIRHDRIQFAEELALAEKYYNVEIFLDVFFCE